MAMNVKPIAALDERINDIRRRTAQIVNEDILPNEAGCGATTAAARSATPTGGPRTSSARRSGKGVGSRSLGPTRQLTPGERRT